jgi:hypothetical protein
MKLLRIVRTVEEHYGFGFTEGSATVGVGVVAGGDVRIV